MISIIFLKLRDVNKKRKWKNFLRKKNGNIWRACYILGLETFISNKYKSQVNVV